MNRIFAFLFFAIAAYGFSSYAIGECDQLTKEYIQGAGGDKEAAIASAKETVADIKNDKSGPFWKLPKNQREEKFIALEETATEVIRSIQSCTENDLASIAQKTKPSQSSGAASNCPSEYSWPFSAGCGSKLRVLPNGHLLYNGCPEAGDPWKDEGMLGASNDRRGFGWPGLDEFYECHLAAQKGNSVFANSGANGTQAQINVGNASEAVGRKEGGKSAWKRGDSQTSQSQSQQASDTGAQGSNGSQKSKYVSKDATHCVEIVPKGFKCDGPYDRFVTNICMTKISVRWRLGADPWGMQELAPKGCTPVSPFRDQRSVEFKACSWDPKANHGPYSDPCRY